MEAKIRELAEFIEKHKSGEDLRFEHELTSMFLDLFNLSGVKALVILEKPGKDMCMLGSDISYAALMTFLVRLFIDHPVLFMEVTTQIRAILTNAMEEADNNTAIH